MDGEQQRGDYWQRADEEKIPERSTKISEEKED
jgi:hypothetical protein